MSHIKKISIITVCRNAIKYIDETMYSVIEQTALKNKRIELEYIIIDGYSNDGSSELILRLIHQFPHIDFKFISEVDQGFYDGLAKGLSMTTGDLIGYINAGDYLNKFAFDVLLDVFEQKPDLKWATGLNVIYNDFSQITSVSTPYRYRRSAIRNGLHGTLLPIIQQESTFWRGILNRTIDLNYLRNLKFAGDAFLWKCFATSADLVIIQSYLGGFRIHSGQISSNLKEYRRELKKFSERASIYVYIVAIIDKLIFMMPFKVKKFFNKQGILSFNAINNKWE